MTLRPRPRATPAMVTSSCVGPTPPEVNTTSYERRKWATASAISSSSSGMVRMRRTVTPSLRSSRVRKAELVSTTLPERIALPMMRMPALRSGCSATLGFLDRDGVFAEVAGPDAHVHHRRPARAERALEGGAQLLRTLDPLAVPTEGLDHEVVAAGRELARGGPVRTVHLHLTAQDLRPGSVVADDPDDIDLLPDAGLELHHVEAEGAVAVHDDHVALG